MEKINTKVTQEANKECFVIMPFSDGETYEKGHFRSVYEDIIVPAITNSGFIPQRADDAKQTNLIHLDILKRLIDAPICVCDLSSRNPNVLFELGIRQAFDKPVVLIQESGTPKIFDITMLRIIEYSKDMKYRDVLNVQQSLSDAILATLDVVSDSANVNSIIQLLSISSPATIPQLDKRDRKDLTFDILSSQITDVKKMLEMVVEDSKSPMKRRSVAAYEFERLSRKLDRILEMQSKGIITREFHRAIEEMEEEIIMARRLVSSSHEMEAFMMLEERLRRVLSSTNPK